MTLPKSYLTTSKNLPSILEAIQGAKAPDKFTVRFLESLGFKSTSDRLVIGVLKSLGLLNDTGTPTNLYFEFLDRTRAPQILANAIQTAYADLFQINTNAQNLSKSEVVNKLKTLSQGQISDSVADKMAMTFLDLCKLSDFKSAPLKERTKTPEEEELPEPEKAENKTELARSSYKLGGLHYNIQIILPESRDPKVYDALFQSLKTHLF